MMNLSSEAAAKARRIRLVLVDVDGVMTDGRLWFLPDGTELKAFHAADGVGIRLAQRAGLVLGVITGRRSAAVEHRCKELDIDELHQGDWRKLGTYQEILARRGLTPEEACFIGDDLVDLPVMRRCGLAAAPVDAHPLVREVADVVSTLPGGAGAVREILEGILKAQGRWDELMQLYP